MTAPEEVPALRQKAIELLETAQKITEEIGDETRGFLSNARWTRCALTHDRM